MPYVLSHIDVYEIQPVYTLLPHLRRRDSTMDIIVEDTVVSIYNHYTKVLMYNHEFNSQLEVMIYVNRFMNEVDNNVTSSIADERALEDVIQYRNRDIE